MKHQYYKCKNWPGGVYVTPGIPGSRSCVPAVACYYILKMLGRKKYDEIAKQIVKTRKIIQVGIEKIVDKMDKFKKYVDIHGQHEGW